MKLVGAVNSSIGKPVTTADEISAFFDHTLKDLEIAIELFIGQQEMTQFPIVNAHILVG